VVSVSPHLIARLGDEDVAMLIVGWFLRFVERF